MQDYVNLEIIKKRGSSINPDIHHSKVPSSDSKLYLVSSAPKLYLVSSAAKLYLVSSAAKLYSPSSEYARANISLNI